MIQILLWIINYLYITKFDLISIYIAAQFSQAPPGLICCERNFSLLRRSWRFGRRRQFMPNYCCQNCHCDEIAHYPLKALHPNMCESD